MRRNKLKIIFSHYGTIDGGDACGFTRSYKLAHGLVKEGHEVIFMTCQKKGFKLPFYFENREGVKIYAFPEFLPYSFRKGGLGTLSILLKIFFVAFTKADVVHSDTGHRPSSGIPCTIHRLIYRSKYFSEWWEHFGKGGIYDDLPRWYQLSLGSFDYLFEVSNRKKANACLPISTKLKERGIENGIPQDRLLVLNGGADIDKIAFNTSSIASKEHFELPIDNFVIGLIGINDSEFINNLNLFNAIKKLIHQGVKIKVIGTGKVNPDLIAKHGFAEDNFLKIYNWLPYEDFAALIGCADLFSLILEDTLRNQSRFPNKLGDYLAAGRPVIANKVGEVAIYAEKYPDVFYIINDNEDEIVDKLKLAHLHWKENTVNYENIRNIAIENSWLQRAKELSKFYDRICYN